MTVLAGNIVERYFDHEKKAFTPKGKGPKFGIRVLNYWQWQELLAAKEDPVAQVRLAISLSLADIDGSTSMAGEFLANPFSPMVNPLFAAIVDIAAGN